MNLKLSLLAASLFALGGCVAPGYDYVRPGYSGSGGYYDGGYYAGGYYDNASGYYSDYYDGCCYPPGVSIGVGVGYGYPGYYAWGNYPYGYYGYNGYYYDHGHHHHHHGDHDGDDHHHGDPAGNNRDHHWDESVQGDTHDRYHRQGDRFDASMQHWPRAESHAQVRAPGPALNDATRSGAPIPQPQPFSAHAAPRVGFHPDSGAAAYRPEPPPQSSTPHRTGKPKTQQF
ncbi:MAG: hypothetical protein ACREPP_01415 [Rhodanobacteraceae bacterium]